MAMRIVNGYSRLLKSAPLRTQSLSTAILWWATMVWGFSNDILEAGTQVEDETTVVQRTLIHAPIHQQAHMLTSSPNHGPCRSLGDVLSQKLDGKKVSGGEAGEAGGAGGALFAVF